MQLPSLHPAESSSLFARPLWSLTLLCCQFPAAVLVSALLLAALSLYWSYEHLGLKMSRLDLINPNSSFNQLWLDYIDEFGDFNEVIIVVEGTENNEVIPALELLAEKIKQFPDRYQGILHGVDLSVIHQKGLHFIPVKDLQTIQQFVARSLNPQAPPAAPMDDVANLLTTLSQSNTAEETMKYFLFPTQEGVIGFVLLRLIDIDKTKFSQGTEAIQQLRDIVGEVRYQYPALQIGLTGMPILENDEMEMSNAAMSKATILAFVGVCVVFMAAFGSLRHPLLAVIALGIAFAWTMGYITLAVGHLNILSIAFGAMLIGLGTDFSVHYLGKYLTLRRSGGEVVESLCQSAILVGPGIVTGGLTTAAAFYAASCAEFTGVAELGTIVGGGILFCMIATFTVFPAMIVLTTPVSPDKNAPSYNLLDIRSALSPVYLFPKFTLFVFLVGFIALLPGIPKVWYDHNLLNLQPVGLESVEIEQRLLSMEVDKGGKNVWFALSIADTKEELLKRKELFKQKYPDLKTEEIVSFFPETDSQRQTVAIFPETVPERMSIIQSLAEMLKNVPDQLPPMMPAELAERFGHLQSLKRMVATAVAESPAIEDLPESLVTRFVGRHGRHLMRIYSTANIWDMDEMKQFVQAVRDIDPTATGSPLQTYESSLQMQAGFVSAACYAFIAVLILTWIDFRSLAASIAAILPMLLGLVMMFGVIGLLDLPLNPANMIVLPIIIGIGIDYGIHLVHDYRHRCGDRYTISASTATSILITSLTTFVGFGSMMIASHRGLQSLGRIFVIGMACCLITSVIVLPAMLYLRSRYEKKGQAGATLPKQKRLIRRGV